MKRVSILLVLLLLFVGSQTQAGDKFSADKKAKYEKIEDNLLVGLNSDNFGLKVSSAYMLGEIKSEKAVISLTRILRSENDERARFTAALALLKIGTERSIFVVKREGIFNDSEKVSKMCEHMYNAHLVNSLKLDTDTKSDSYLAHSSK
ncbi:HEAT repeat domain-containing protein [Bacteroidota bacterium]